MPAVKLNVKLIRHTLAPEEVVALGARLCYSKARIDNLTERVEKQDQTDFCCRILQMGHESVMEHASFTFGVEGVSRVLLAQLTRHRMASFSVQSQRYVRLENFEHVTPPEIAKDPEAAAAYAEMMESQAKSYQKLASILKENHKKELMAAGDDEKTALRKAEKMAIEDARFVLPNACETHLIVTMNARQLKTFLGLRLCNRAQWEIRELAGKMLEVVLPYLPNIFSERMAKCDQVGYCTERKSCGRKPKLDDILACWEKYGGEMRK